MVGNTVPKFNGHIIFSFTRSVAEHFDFDEAERDLELFGYNPLDDTGKESYCHPVDELIYQEYSDRDVTTLDYLPSSKIQARLNGRNRRYRGRRKRKSHGLEAV